MNGLELLLALDFGGTKHAAGLAALGGRSWLAHRAIPAPADSDGPRDREAVFGLADALLSKTPGRLRAIGVSFGGPVDWATGRVILSHHVPGWSNTPLSEILTHRYGAPAVMDNDANVAALGEWRFGAGRGAASLFYITVSTGIGGGWVVDGRILRGADSMAGEIGHLAIDPSGPTCVCGKRGCVEAIGSGTSIGRAMESLRPGQGWTGAQVNEAAEAGDPQAIIVMERSAAALGQGIGYAITLLNPDRVIIGGGVAGAGKIYWQKLRETAAAFVLPQMRVQVAPAGLRDDSPLWGAVAIAEASLV
jgi:glucokinase